MTEATTANKDSYKPNKLNQPIVASSSLSTVLISAIQLLDSAPEVKSILSSIAPIFVGGLVYGIHWLFVCWDIKPIGVMQTEKALNKKIQQLRDDIQIELDAGRDVTKLEEALHHNLIARSKLT